MEIKNPVQWSSKIVLIPLIKPTWFKVVAILVARAPGPLTRSDSCTWDEAGGLKFYNRQSANFSVIFSFNKTFKKSLIYIIFCDIHLLIYLTSPFTSHLKKIISCIIFTAKFFFDIKSIISKEECIKYMDVGTKVFKTCCLSLIFFLCIFYLYNVIHIIPIFFIYNNLFFEYCPCKYTIFTSQKKLIHMLVYK